MPEPRPWETSVFTAAPAEALDSVLPAGPSTPVDTPSSRYTPGPELGRGGMGVVRLVHDAWLKRDVALKRPHGEWGEVLHVRIVNEARLTARLSHPSIALLLDVGHDDEGPFYTMPVLVGTTLRKALDGLTLLEGVRVLVAVARALHYAHEQGVVHRDLKPSNVLVGVHGEVWVLDWGLAADVGSPPDPTAGTPGFMAPEQGTSPVAPCADVFGLGRMLETVLDAVPTGSDELRSVVVGCTAPVGERWASMSPVLDALTAWQNGLPVRGHAYPLASALRLWVSQHRLVLGATAGVALCVAILLSAWVQSSRTAARATRTALATVLAIQAETERARGHQARAEVLAAEALVQGPEPVAWGVLTSRASRAPSLLDRFDRPCPDPTLDPSGRIFCVEEDQIRELALDGTLRETWKVVDVEEAGRVEQVQGVPGGVLVRHAAHVVVLQRQGQTPRVIHKRDETLEFTSQMGVLRTRRSLAQVKDDEVVWHDPLCAEQVEGLDEEDGRFVVACRRGDVVWGDGEQWQREALGLHLHRALFVGDQILVTTWDGRLGLRQPDGTWSWRGTGVGAVADLEVLDANRVALGGEHGEVVILDLSGVGAGIALPGPVEALGRVDDHLVLLGRSFERWQVAESGVMAFDQVAEGGVSSLALTSNGETMLVGHASGQQGTIDVETGELQTWLPTGERVSKGGVFLDEDRMLLLDGLTRRVVNRRTGEQSTWEGGLFPRAVAFQGQAFTYGWRKSSFTSAPRESLGEVAGAVVFEDRLYALRTNGELHRFDAPDPTTREVLFSGLAVGRLGVNRAGVVVADGGALRSYDWNGTPGWQIDLPRPASALAVSDSWVVVGDRLGGLTAYGADGTLRVEIPSAHQRLVSGVLLHGEQVYSGSFDGFVRRWNLGVVDASPVELRRDLQAQWGLRARDVLRR